VRAAVAPQAPEELQAPEPTGAPRPKAEARNPVPRAPRGRRFPGYLGAARQNVAADLPSLLALAAIPRHNTVDIYGGPENPLFRYRPGAPPSHEEPQAGSSGRLEVYAAQLPLASEKERISAEAVLRYAWRRDQEAMSCISHLLGLQLKSMRLRSGRETARCAPPAQTGKAGKWLIWEEVGGGEDEESRGSPVSEPSAAAASGAASSAMPGAAESSPSASGAEGADVARNTDGANGAGSAHSSNGQGVPPRTGRAVGALVIRWKRQADEGSRGVGGAGGAVIDYVAALRSRGGQGWPMVLAAEAICRRQGLGVLYSAADLSQTGQFADLAPRDEAQGREIRSAIAAHRRWGFVPSSSEEWKASGLELYDQRKCRVHYMKKVLA